VVVSQKWEVREGKNCIEVSSNSAGEGDVIEVQAAASRGMV